MSVAKWLLIPVVCGAIAWGSASTALASNKHVRHKPAAGKTVHKPAAMSKTSKAPKHHKAGAKKKANRRKVAPASHAVKRNTTAQNGAVTAKA